MATVNEELADAGVRHQVGLMRLKNATVRKILNLLARMDARIVARLTAEDLTDLGRQRQEEMLAAIRRIVAEGHEVLYDEALADHLALATYEGEFQERAIRGALPVVLDTITPSAAQLYAAVQSRPFQGKILREWYAELEEGSQRRLRDTIRMGWTEGRTTDQMIRDVRGTRKLGYKDGVLEINRRSAEAVVRTAVNHTANAARSELYRQNANVIKGVQWVSTLDSRTTPICQARDGNVYPVDKGPRPPAHWNCRSTTVPVLKSWKELGIDLKEAPAGTRASMNGQVAGDLTYGEWLRRQSAEFQDEVLGKTKGALFRRGGLDVKAFVNNRGDEYTLDELRRREAEAFEKAGL